MYGATVPPNQTPSQPYPVTQPTQPYGGGGYNPSTMPNGQPYSVATVQNPNTPQAAQVAAPPTPAEYATALQQSLSPGFQQQTQQMLDAQNATGVLDSGQGSQGLQYLTGQQNATYANALLPLIQQGYGQQFQANEANAGAQNALNAQGFAQAYGASGQNAGAQNQTNEFNAGQNQNYQLAQMGYGNEDYLAQLQAMAGIYGTGQQAVNSEYGAGQGYNNEYGNIPASSTLPYASGVGAATQVPGLPGYGGQQAGGSGNYGGWSEGSGSGSQEGTGESAGGY